MTITLIRAVIIYIVIVTSVRIAGKRQIGELKPHELVITILISSVATIPIQENAIPLANSILPIILFVSFEIIESALSMKSLKFRNLLQGKPIFIIKDGVLQQKELKRLRYTIDDLVDAIRQEGAFDISTVENAIIETNGSVSVQLKAEESPITPSQLNLSVAQSEVPITIVMDSNPIEEYFGDMKFTKNEIELYTKAHGINNEEIMLLTLDDNGKLYLIRKDKK